MSETASLSANRLDRIAGRLMAPVDAASLAVFRIGFGLVMAAWCFDDLRNGRVHELYERPRFHFTYGPFDFIRPWGGAGMTLHFVGLMFAALCMAAGLLYRAASLVFAVGFTAFFLMERANYQNHYYLIALLAWVCTILPLHREWSLDVLNGLAPRSPELPAWMLGLVRFHVALPYVFGGIAKFDHDWLAGEPMRQVLSTRADVPVIGGWLVTESAVQFFTWGGLVFDLAIVPLLLWRPTRRAAYVVAVLFHVANATLFHIHVFPWFMIFATTIFLDPSWPRRLLHLPSAAGQWRSLEIPPARWIDVSRSARVGFLALAVYGLFHLVWPLRHLAYGDQTAWTERGHFFSWRMMLRTKTSGLRYLLRDPATGERWSPDINRYLNEEQSQKFSRDPEMILQFAHFLADEERRATGREVEVRVFVLTSLNGRKPELLIDPEVNLAAEPRGWHSRPWIRPMTEPLRAESWRVPIPQWVRALSGPAVADSPQSPQPTEKPSIRTTSAELAADVAPRP